jgi:phage FluMu protein Com
MENLRIRCRSCGKELEGISGKTLSCGCPNMATIRGDKISALDLGQVIMLNSYGHKSKSGVLSNEDLAFQEARRQRKVRRLDFEIR